MLENHLTKRKILEVYLNIIEYGKDLYGISAATQHYFSKYPFMINPREAAFIAMLLPSPKKYSQSFREKKLTPFARKRIKEILKKMEMGHYLTQMQLEWSIKTRFSWETEPFSDQDVWNDDQEVMEDEESESGPIEEELTEEETKEVEEDKEKPEEIEPVENVQTDSPETIKDESWTDEDEEYLSQ